MSETVIFEKNKQNIEKRINLGLDLMRKHYELKEIDTGDFKHLKIQTMEYHVAQYEVVGVGNLLVMECKDSPGLQMDSFVLTPYFKNLPLFSTDYMYIQERRSFLNEIYSLVDKEDELYRKYIGAFAENKASYDHLTDMPVQACWYDDIRPVCTAKNTAPENDEEIIQLFMRNLEIFIEMEKATPHLDAAAYNTKWQKTQDYTDALVDSGGVSTDVFKAVLGPEKTKEFFNSVFFAPALYKQ